MIYSHPHLPVHSLEDVTLNMEAMTKALTAAESLAEHPANALAYLQLLNPGNHKIAFGAAEIEWTVKQHESAATEVKTGLGSIGAFVGFSTNQILLGYTTVSGGNVKVTGYDVASEPAVSTKTGFYWIAIV